ncbi:MAG: glycosyltransferase [Pedobacter sp.]|nr:glycosyltransferase [Pedobacter sp.]
MIDFSNTDMLFVGGVIPREIEAEVLSKSKRGNQLAANNFQWSLIRGFDACLGSPVTLMNIMFVGSFPKNYTDMLIPALRFSHAPGADDKNLGFVNITTLKQFLRPFGERSFIRRWVQRSKENRQKVVFIYSLSPHFIRIARLLKKFNPDVFICISVNDLPEHTMLGQRGQKPIARAWKQYNKRRVTRALQYIDGYMVVTEHIAEALGVAHKPHVVVEGLVDFEDDFSLMKSTAADDKLMRIVYTGGLTDRYGVMNLVRAFRLTTDPDYRLVICGDGDDKLLIIEAALEDRRIEFHGVLSPAEVRKIQESATVLVNPRQNTGDFTRYSFPIKTIEYLLAGNPVIGYKLDGFPGEYDQYMLYVEDNSIESLKDKIDEICRLEQVVREKMGNENRRFIVEKKNHIIQTRRIMEMISRAYNKRNEK